MAIREKFSDNQGEVLVLILDLPVCSNFSFSSKQGEVSQTRETFSPKLPSRLSPELCS